MKVYIVVVVEYEDDGDGFDSVPYNSIDSVYLSEQKAKERAIDLHNNFKEVNIEIEEVIE